MADTTYRIDVRKEVTERLTVHTNVTQEVVVTTVDKMRLCLMRHSDQLRARGGWGIPLGVVLALIPTLVAADFRDSLGIKKEYWWALFLVATIAASAWLVVAAGRAIGATYRAYRKGSLDSVEHIVTELKAHSGPVQVQSAVQISNQSAS